LICNKYSTTLQYIIIDIIVVTDIQVYILPEHVSRKCSGPENRMNGEQSLKKIWWNGSIAEQ